MENQSVTPNEMALNGMALNEYRDRISEPKALIRTAFAAHLGGECSSDDLFMTIEIALSRWDNIDAGAGMGK